MAMQHEATGVPTYVAAGVLAVYVMATVLWAVAAHRASARSGWRRGRSASFHTGMALGGASLLVSVGARDLRTHMAAHVILGMVVPILLAWSAPATLALRALPVNRARALSRLLRSRPVHWGTHPLPVAALDAGGLWLIYRGGLHERAMGSPAVSAALGAHVLITGTLLAVVLSQVDPVPRRSPPLRATALMAVMASHSVLSKAIYAAPPGWAARSDAEQGAMIMYYGGDAAHLILVVLICRAWAHLLHGYRPGRIARDLPAGSPRRRDQRVIAGGPHSPDP